jgi:peptide/nickel transport system ATP-binding protein
VSTTISGAPRAAGADGPPRDVLLEVDDLRTIFTAGAAPLAAVDGVGFTIERGRSLAIVGESGAGKSAVAKTLTGLLPRSGVERSGRAVFEGVDLLQQSDEQMREILGPRIGVLFQDPMSYLNPVIRIGEQVTERMRQVTGRSRDEAAARAEELLSSVGVPDARRRLRQYPHELSGGTRQRVALAIALACDPSLLIADEPTTALDATVQAQVVALLREQRGAGSMCVLHNTPDLRLAAEVADDIVVMYAGQIVESGTAQQVLESPRMPYTRALLDAAPRAGARGALTAIPGEVPNLAAPPVGCRFASRCWAATETCRTTPPPLEVLPDGSRRRCWYPDAADRRPEPPELPEIDDPSAATHPLVVVEDLSVTYRVPGSRRRLQAIAGVDFEIRRGETLAVVGESGCGKSTLAKAIMGGAPVSSGRILLEGRDLSRLSRRALREARPTLQMVFQDPFSSLNPLRRVSDIVAEPLAVWGRGDGRSRRAAADEALRLVGLDPRQVGDRQPYQLSGGQSQRVAIARALVLGPELLVCDEPVSALDVSVQAQVVNLLMRLKRELSLTLLFISHDLAVVSRVADRVLVMYLGKVVELADVDELYARPRHPYTAALLAAGTDGLFGGQVALHGELPSPTDVPTGCRFRTRCPFATAICAEVEPPLPDDPHAFACHHPMEVTR